MKNITKIWYVIPIFAVVVVGVILFLAQQGRRAPETEVERRPSPKPTPVKVDIQLQQEAIEQSRQTITLADVTGGGSRGTATRSFDGTNFLHTVSAQLPPPPQGDFYEGWLVSSTEQPAVLSTGKLNLADPGIYALVYSKDRSLYGHNQVVVTVETKDDGVPETHILEGNF